MDVIEAEELEIEMSRYVHRVLDFKRHLAEILNRYNVAEPEDIKRMISQQKIEAHPAYEDYLDAISYQELIKEAIRHLEDCIEKIKGIS